MRLTDHPEARIVGHVNVQVASRVYEVPVQAAPLNGTSLEPGFFSGGPHEYGILVDSAAPDAVQRDTILRGSEEAARFISRKLLN